MVGGSIKPRVTSMGVQSYKVDSISTATQNSIDILIVLPLMAMFLGLIQKLLNEKEKKVREGMKMMGMTNLSFYLSWFITYFLILLVIAVIVSLIMTRRIITGCNFEVFFILYMIFGITLIFQSIFISVFFVRVKPGTIFGILFYLLNYLLRTFLGSGASMQTLQLGSISAHAAFSLAIQTMLTF